MLHLPVVRWGKAYESLEREMIVHFATGEPIAEISQATGGLLKRDVRQATVARQALRAIPTGELLERLKRAGELFASAELPLGNGAQSAEEFIHAQSASSGLPEAMCRANIAKNAFVLANMREILDCLTRGLDLEILRRGYGVESRGVVVSYQAQTPVLGAVLPSNSPGVHTLWLPAIAMQIGLMLKPGSQEPWTPYRMAAAMIEAGIPAEAIAIYPGAGGEVGAALLASCERSMVFGGEQTIAQYAANPKVQAHGPGWSKIVIGDDCIDRWEDYLDLMVESIASNGGRSCINASGVWASRHTREIAQALAERLGPIEPTPPTDREAKLAAFTVPGMAQGVWGMLEADLREAGVTDCTASYGPRLVEHERYAYLRPMIVHCDAPERAIARKEFMFPFASVVACPHEKLATAIGPTLVCTAITKDERLQNALADNVHVDRLNLGPLATNRLDWHQPHEGNLFEFLYRARALQVIEG